MKKPDRSSTFFKDAEFQTWLNHQIGQSNSICAKHGDYNHWQKTLDNLSRYKAENYDLSQDIIQIGEKRELSQEACHHLKKQLQRLHPWRKGPFNLFGIEVDSEWRSDYKWQRLSGEISALENRSILDVGCGNGYFILRMIGEGAKRVLGIDPTVLVNMQFRALTSLMTGPVNANMLPIGIDDLPDDLASFDSVFSMGILYHRRSPIDHLRKLFSCLRPGGELILETLVIDETGEKLLVPRSRYAKMRNVWFIPTTKTLEIWLHRTGYRNIRLIDVTATSPEEQRSTEWMRYESLSDFLDPNDESRTLEGYPAPTRAIFVANR